MDARAVGRMSSGSRSGVALVVSVVVLLALTVLAHGALVLAGAESRAAEALARGMATRLVGRAALGRAAGVLAADTLPTLGDGTADTVAVGGGVAVVERLARELFLMGVVADTSVGADPGRADPPWPVEGLLWAADPLARAGAVAAVVSAAGDVGGSGTIETDGFFEIEAEDGAACDAWWAGLDSLAEARPPPLPTGRLQVDPSDPNGAVGAALRIGWLPADSVLRRLTAFPPGVVTPAPWAGATSCFDVPDNWGAPTDPTGPCGGRRVGLAVDGSLVMEGGEGQGVLAVTGDLTLRGRATFAGMVLVGGDLRVEGGSVLRGVARAGGTATVDGRMDGGACPVVSVVAAASPVRRPLRLRAPFLDLR